VGNADFVINFTRWNAHMRFSAERDIITVERFGVPLAFVKDCRGIV